MRLIHLSDLHFGKTNDTVIQIFSDFVKNSPEKIDGILVTGDLTQRARSQQFIDAVRFIGGFKFPIVVAVPGNHDVPLYNLFLRIFKPYAKYNKFVSMASTYFDQKVCIYGMRTVNPWVVQEGKISLHEVEQAEDFFRKCGSRTNKNFAGPSFGSKISFKIKISRSTFTEIIPSTVRSHFVRS